MKTTLTTKEEDELSDLLSNLTPMAYSQLMAKVKRRQWEQTGMSGHYSTPQNRVKKWTS